MGNTFLVVRMPFHRLYIYTWNWVTELLPSPHRKFYFMRILCGLRIKMLEGKKLTLLYIQWTWHFTQVRCPSFLVISVSSLRRRWTVKTEGQDGHGGEADKRPSPQAGSWAFQTPELNLCHRNVVSFDMNATSHILFFKSFYTPTPGSLFYSSLKSRGSSFNISDYRRPVCWLG